MLGVHHVRTRGQVVEHRHTAAATVAGPGPPVGTAPTSDLALGEHRQTCLGEDHAPIHLGHHHPHPGHGEVGGSLGVEVGGNPGCGQQFHQTHG